VSCTKRCSGPMADNSSVQANWLWPSIVAVIVGLLLIQLLWKGPAPKKAEKTIPTSQRASRKQEEPGVEQEAPAAAIEPKPARQVQKPAPGPPLTTHDQLRWLQILAVRNCANAVLSQGPAGDPDRLRRQIWEYLDDCPNVIATGCADGKARLHDVRSGRQLVSTRHDATNREGINSVLLTPGPTGPVLLTGAWDGRWHEWDLWPTRPAKPAEFLRGESGVGHDNHVHGLALNHDCNYLACACSTGRVLVYRRNCPTREIKLFDADDVADLKESLKLGDHGEFVVQRRLELAEGAIIVEPQEHLLPEASLEGFKKRSDLDAVELPGRFRLRFVGCLTNGYRKAWRTLEHGGAVHCLVLTREGSKEYLFSGSRDRMVRKWSLLDGELELTLRGHSSMVRCLAENAIYLASGGDDRSICIWRRDEIASKRGEAECSSRIVSHTDFVRAVALCSSFPERLLSASDDQRVILWNLRTKEKLREYQHPCSVAAVVLMGPLLATAGEDGRLRIWQTESAELQHSLKHPQRLTSLSSMRIL